MNSSNVSGVERDFDKWWNEAVDTGRIRALYKSDLKEAWDAQQARIDRLEEIGGMLRDIASSHAMQTYDRSGNIGRLIKEWDTALTLDSQEGK